MGSAKKHRRVMAPGLTVIQGARRVELLYEDSSSDITVAINRYGFFEVEVSSERPYCWVEVDPCDLLAARIVWEEWEDAEWVIAGANRQEAILASAV